MGNEVVIWEEIKLVLVNDQGIELKSFVLPGHVGDLLSDFITGDTTTALLGEDVTTRLHFWYYSKWKIEDNIAKRGYRTILRGEERNTWSQIKLVLMDGEGNDLQSFIITDDTMNIFLSFLIGAATTDLPALAFIKKFISWE